MSKRRKLTKTEKKGKLEELKRLIKEKGVSHDIIAYSILPFYLFDTTKEVKEMEEVKKYYTFFGIFTSDPIRTIYLIFNTVLCNETNYFYVPKLVVNLKISEKSMRVYENRGKNFDIIEKLVITGKISHYLDKITFKTYKIVTLKLIPNMVYYTERYSLTGKRFKTVKDLELDQCEESIGSFNIFIMKRIHLINTDISNIFDLTRESGSGKVYKTDLIVKKLLFDTVDNLDKFFVRFKFNHLNALTIKNSGIGKFLIFPKLSYVYFDNISNDFVFFLFNSRKIIIGELYYVVLMNLNDFTGINLELFKERFKYVQYLVLENLELFDTDLDLKNVRKLKLKNLKALKNIKFNPETIDVLILRDLPKFTKISYNIDNLTKLTIRNVPIKALPFDDKTNINLKELTLINLQYLSDDFLRVIEFTELELLTKRNLRSFTGRGWMKRLPKTTIIK